HTKACKLTLLFGLGISDRTELHSPSSGSVHSTSTVMRDRVGDGSWLCENAGAGSLTDLDCSAAKLGEVCEHIFPISSSTQPDAAPRIVSAPGPARAAKVRAHHALTAAIIGLTPKIFSTRVKL